MSAARWLHPSRSLPARISLLVLGATVLTSVTVTAISVRSLDAFLRSEIEQSFPSVLAAATKRIDLWYQQREMDVGVFARSDILRANTGRLGAGSGAAQRAAAEIDQYLRYVLDGFPQFRALFLRDPEGATLRWVGDDVALPAGALTGPVPAAEVRVGGLAWAEGRRFQVVSASLEDLQGRRVGSLHALLSLDALDAELAQIELAAAGHLDVLDARERVVSSTRPDAVGRELEEGLPELARDEAVTDQVDAAGVRQVGSLRTLDRLDWTLMIQVPYAEAFAPVASTIRRILAIDLLVVGALALAAFRLVSSITRPIEALSQAAQRISEGGDPDELPEERSEDEVGVLTRAFRAMTVSLASTNQELVAKNDELQRANEVLEQLSITDGLTKLHNHRYFQDQLVKEVRRAERTGRPLALILADIDHFKAWNDELGHAVGDEILALVAGSMSAQTRDADLLARYGGEEFAVLAPETGRDDAQVLAERMRGAVREAAHRHERDLTASFGVAVYDGCPERLFRDADRALYAAKEDGRDCVVVAADG